MSNQTYNDFLAKAATPGILEVVSDNDLIGLHKLCKANQNETNNLLKSRSHQWLPLIEGEIVFRKEAIVKAEEEDTLRKSEDDDADDDEEESEDDDSEKEEKKEKPKTTINLKKTSASSTN